MEKESFFEKWSWLFALCFSLIGFAFLFAPIIEVENAEEVTEGMGMAALLSHQYPSNWLTISLLALIAVGVVFIILGKLFKKASGSLYIVAIFANILAICALILLPDTFNNMNSDLGLSASMAWGTPAILICLAISSFFAITSTKYGKETTVRDMAEDAILLSSALVLNFIKLWSAPTGGSVNLQMLPLMVICLRRGPAHGFIACGVIYGLLSCITDGYGFYTYPFDYLLGFGSAAVLGFFRPLIFSENQKTYNVKGIIFIIVGGLAATAIRFIAGTTSSMVLYGYDFAAAMLYNVGYVFLSGALAIAALVLLYGPLCQLEKLFPSRKKAKAEQ